MSHVSNIKLLDEQNHEVALNSLWRDGPVVLFFMRQLGCGLCRQQLLRLKDHAAQFTAQGCRVAVVIMGDGTMAQGLRSLYSLPFPVYADAAMSAYGAFDIGEGSLWDVINPNVVARQIGTALKGMRPMWGAGSIKQLGGIVLLNQQGNILYHYIANPIYKYPPWSEVLGALAANTTYATIVGKPASHEHAA